MLSIGNNTHIEGFANNYLPSVGRKTLGIIAAITFVAIAILFFVRRSKATPPIITPTPSLESSSAPQAQIIDPIEMEKSLASWAQKCGDAEKPNRKIAAEKILHAREHNLSKLELTSLNLTEIPPEIGLLTQLTELSLSNNQFTSLPATLGNLIQLKGLYLHSNQLTSLPATLGSLNQLTQLYLHSNQLTSLPATLGNLNQLTQLYLSNNQLTSLPATLGNLNQLTLLRLNNNQLTSLPATLGNLNQLTQLHLDNNQLTSLPATLGNLNQLTYLYLCDNQLTSLPATLGNLNQLTYLHLYNNQLTSFPATFGNLIQLTSLSLSNNQFTSLPATLGNLNQLTYLYLSNNQLTSLPATLGNLNQLTNLSLGNNQLTSLPLALGNIPGLTSLDCDDNPNLPQEQVRAILDLARARREEGAEKSLPTLLKTWKTYSGQEARYTFTAEQFKKAEVRSINEWLTRLAQTSDFRKHQPELAKVVCDLLEGLKDPAFKTLFFVSVNANQEGCGDRAAMGLNELFTAYKIHFLPEDAPLQEKLQLLASGAKTNALRCEIAKCISRWQEEHLAEYKESVETYLYYEAALKERLNLLTAISTSIYADGMGPKDWIDIGALVQSVEDTYLTTLLETPSAKALIDQPPPFTQEWARLEAESHKELELLETSLDTEWTKKTKMDAISYRLAAAKGQALTRWLQEHPAATS